MIVAGNNCDLLVQQVPPLWCLGCRFYCPHKQLLGTMKPGITFNIFDRLEIAGSSLFGIFSKTPLRITTVGYPSTSANTNSGTGDRTRWKETVGIWNSSLQYKSDNGKQFVVFIRPIGKTEGSVVIDMCR